MAEHETIADIIAWLRKPREGENAYLTLWRDEIADRLEAALKRESDDCAKLREALKLCMDEMCNRCRDLASARGNPLPCLQGCEPVRKAKAALSAPPRNCDRFADETDAQIAFLNEVWLISVTKETALERDKFENWTDEMRSRYAKWLLATATEQKGQENG